MKNHSASQHSRSSSTSEKRAGLTQNLLQGLAGLLLLSIAPASAGASTLPPSRTAPPATPYLTPLVQREIDRAPLDGAAFETIYLRQVRSLAEASTFFYSAAFLRLHLADQRRVIDRALALDPITFLPQTDFLPFSLREEYRNRALEAAEEQVLRQLRGLTIEEEVSLYLPRRQGARQGAAGAKAFDPAAQVRRLLRDPELRQLGRIADDWVAELAGPFVSAEALIEVKVMVARNLRDRGLTATRETVALVLQEIAATRAELAQAPLFRGRQVVFLAGKEGLAEGPTFGKDSTLAALRAQEPAALTLLRSGEKGALTLLARNIREADRLTLLIETHGRPGALEFSGALAADELAAMFAARQGKSQAIVIFNTCFGHDFARAFADRLRARGADTPILIVPEEFGQATLVGRQESGFTRDELGIGRRPTSTLAELWTGQLRQTTVYARMATALSQIR